MNRSQVLQNIEQLWGKGELEEATHCYALIVVDQISDAASEDLLSCHTPSELANWIRSDALAWQAKLSEKVFAEQFEIGHGNAYGCIEQMLSCVDYAFVFDLLDSTRDTD